MGETKGIKFVEPHTQNRIERNLHIIANQTKAEKVEKRNEKLFYYVNIVVVVAIARDFLNGIFGSRFCPARLCASNRKSFFPLDLDFRARV